MHRLGIEQLSVFGLPPVAFVTLAADLGCSAISTGLVGFGYNPHGYSAFSLREDPALRAEMKAAMRDQGVAITLGEGCIIRPGQEVADYARDMDLFADLGAELLNTISIDPDLDRTLDQLAVFAEMSAERGMASSIELCPPATIANLEMAVASTRHVGRDDFGLLLDTMHLGRSGATAADVAALDPRLIRYVQLCDAPRVSPDMEYFVEATYERRIPGEGELPLLDYLAALPPDVVISLETPMRSKSEAGQGPEQRLAPAVAAMRAMVAEADGRRRPATASA